MTDPTSPSEPEQAQGAQEEEPKVPDSTDESSVEAGLDAHIHWKHAHDLDLQEQEAHYPGSHLKRRPFVPVPTPVTLEVANDLVIWVQGVDPTGRQFRADVLDPMRVEFFERWGVWIPPVQVEVQSQWPQGSFQIKLFDVPVTSGTARRDHLLVAEVPKRLELLGASPEPARHPLWDRPASWVHRKHSHLFYNHPIETWDCGEYLSLILSTTLLNLSAEFVGIQEVRAMLNQLEVEWPTLVEECLQLLPLRKLRRVLRSLAQERVTLYPLRNILEVLIDAAEHTQSTEELVDTVRQKMSLHLCHPHADNFQILSYLLDPSGETELLEQFQAQALGKPETLEVTLARRQRWEDLFAALEKHLSVIPVESTVVPILLVQQRALRRPLQRLLQTRFPWLDVLFVGEINPHFVVLPIATLHLPPASQSDDN